MFDYVVDAVRSPREQLSRGQYFVRHSWELAAYCYRQLQRHRAEGMAAELTYRTIFSLVPVVVLALVMFRIVGGLEEVQNTVENQLYSFFGVPEIPEEYITPSVDEDSAGGEGDQGMTVGDTELLVEDVVVPGASPETTPDEATADVDDTNGDVGGATADIGGATAGGVGLEDTSDPSHGETLESPDVATNMSESNAEQETKSAAESDREARASIRRTLREATAQVAALDFKSIGAIGLLLFIYAAVALADSVEHLFNRIYEAPSQRPVHLRLAIHWSIITLGSGLLAMSLYMSGQVVEWFVAIGAGSTTKWMLSHVFSILASWVLLFLLYALMPNTQVSLRYAAIGSLVGSLLWEGAKFGFQIYVAKAVPYSAIYGSIGLIPLFLFWIYVTWLIVLFGLTLTYTLQSLGGGSLRRMEHREGTLYSGDPDWMLPIMCEVAHAFELGTALGTQELADRLALSSRIVHDMTHKLVDAELIHRVNIGVGEEEGLTLSRPAEKIRIDEILSLAHRVRPTSNHPAWKTLANLKQAEREAAEGKTLADVQDW